MVCEASPAISVAPRLKSFRRLASTRGFKKNNVEINEFGYIRVHEGLERHAVSAQSKLVKIGANTTTAEANKLLGFGEHLTLWVSIGGSADRRLEDNECPLRIQEEFLIRCGWMSADRRTRLSVDPHLRHCLRWSAGPAGRAPAVGLHSGTLWLLKGLVFPQWKARAACTIGPELLIFSANSTGTPDVYQMSGGTIELCQSKAQRLVVMVRPQLPAGVARLDSNKDHHIFLGFTSVWERNTWFSWLKESSQCTRPPSVMDFSGGSQSSVASALEHCRRSVFAMRALRLCRSGLLALPPALFQLESLVALDLSGNDISHVPDEIKQLNLLEELTVSGNSLAALGGALLLPRLKTLTADRNIISQLDMDVTRESTQEGCDGGTHSPLTSVDLRHNRLKGSIILGSYEHLVTLDVSHNTVEVLVVSALRGLRELKADHNSLRHLSLHGAQLRTLLASNNQLETLVTTVPPSNLVQVDVSYNKLESLPPWLSGCSDLTTLHATHNKLTSLPEHLFCSELSSLSSLRLAHNRITTIPSMPRLRAPLKELLLQDNCIHSLPENFFSACDRLCILNLSNNRLNRLPPATGPVCFTLERLYLSANCLDDTIAEVIVAFRGLKILHLSYNCVSVIPETCINVWCDIEEITLSGNMMQRLPENLPRLKYLRVLRAHSNRLRNVPMFAGNSSIKILDLAHNDLDAVDLSKLAPKQLKYLDISCNKKLQVDASQFHAYRCQRPMSLVDVTGQNSLPWQQRVGVHDEYYGNTPWNIGFAESADKNLQLCSAQIRLPAFCNREGLFGIIDSEDDYEVAKLLKNSLPSLLLEEKSLKETAAEYMKYVILSAHRELKEKGQKKGASLVLCHISPVISKDLGFGQSPTKYMVRFSNVGETKAVLCRRNGPLSIGSDNNKRVGFFSQYPDSIPDPEVLQTVMKEDDEFVILGNRAFWKTISIETAITEGRAERNPILAAKRLQDLAQSYGTEDSISVLIVRFDQVRSDVDMLMRELRQTIGNGKTVTTTTCRPDCCCSRVGPCCHSSSPSKPGSDRSSPSGQSDRHTGEYQHSGMHYASVKSGTRGADRRSCRGGVARAIRVRVEEEKEEERLATNPALKAIERPPSEEQFKCWEYMLEQNTQLLFDKELDTISKGIARSNPNALRNIRGLSGSSPQLHLASKAPIVNKPQPPFLSKHFGSARSFGTTFKPDLRSTGRLPAGGPNAAYFGSLQRLMPYHLEYDFAVIQEKSGQSPDSLDLEGRMQQYWGVATTEL